MGVRNLDRALYHLCSCLFVCNGRLLGTERYWIGQKICLGFSKALTENLNELWPTQHYEPRALGLNQSGLEDSRHQNILMA